MGSQKYNCKELIKEYESIKRFVEIVSEAKSEEDCIKKIAKNVYEKLDVIRSIYEEILNPDIGDLAISHEIRGLDLDIQKLWNMYKELMRLMREYELAFLMNDMKMLKEFLKDVEENLEKLILLAKEILEKKKEFWSKDIKYKKPREYLG